MKLFLDLNKGGIDKGKLVRKMVQVKGKNGTFYRMQWVRPGDNSIVFDNKHPYSEQSFDTVEKIKGFNEIKPATKDWENNDVIDGAKLTRGTKLYEWKENMEYSKTLLGKNSLTRNMNIEPSEVVKQIFGDISIYGIKSLFSDESNGYIAGLDHITVAYDKEVGQMVALLDGFWTDSKTKERVGDFSRSYRRDKNGSVYVHTELISIDPKYQSRKIGNTDMTKLEKLATYMSKGNPVHLTLLANISTGTYAWAMKGYDFSSDEDLQLAISCLEEFCKKNKMSVEDVVKKCGYKKIEDLKYSWQFATLDDGNEYKCITEEGNETTGKFGKIFMLNGMEHWNGEKIINAGTEHEEVYNKYVRK